MEKQKQWAKTAAWWTFVSGEKSVGAANRQESSNISGICPKPTLHPETIDLNQQAGHTKHMAKQKRSVGTICLCGMLRRLVLDPHGAGHRVYYKVTKPMEQPPPPRPAPSPCLLCSSYATLPVGPSFSGVSAFHCQRACSRSLTDQAP